MDENIYWLKVFINNVVLPIERQQMYCVKMLSEDFVFKHKTIFRSTNVFNNISCSGHYYTNIFELCKNDIYN